MRNILLTYSCHQQLVITTRKQLVVYDINLHRLVEEVPFDGLSLVSTALKPKERDEPDSISHSLRMYKGKLFVLVSGVFFLSNILP